MNVSTSVHPSASSRPWTIVGHLDLTPADLVKEEAEILEAVVKTPCPDASVVLQVRHGQDLAWAPGSGRHRVELSASESPGVTCESRSSAPPSGEELGRFLTEQMKKYPSQHCAFVVSGHGVARGSLVSTLGSVLPGGLLTDGVGDVSTADIASALRAARAESGHPVDLLLLDACLVGSLESLLPLSDGARYAVVSEEMLYTGVMDWPAALQDLRCKDVGPVELGAAVLKKSAYWTNPRTVSVVDLQQLPALGEAVDRLGQALVDRVRAGKREDVDAAFAAAEKIRDPRNLGHAVEGRLDLGSLLSELGKIDDSAVRDAAREAAQVYGHTVVSHSASPQYRRTTGLSIQGPCLWHREASYARDTGLDAWSNLLAEMRPWPSWREVLRQVW